VDEFVTCVRCGMTFEINRKRKKLRMLCESCRVTKATTIQNGDSKCLPWHGGFDLDMITPINEDGEPVLPGMRVCGNKDCVQPAHVKGQKW
jgi:hypothetical protein